MSEMIERVAAALCEHEGGTFAIDADVYRSRSRTAIKALREPTEAMIKAADDMDINSMDFTPTGGLLEVWQAMIDQALK